MLGGALLISYFGPGPVSVDALVQPNRKGSFSPAMSMPPVTVTPASAINGRPGIWHDDYGA